MVGLLLVNRSCVPDEAPTPMKPQSGVSPEVVVKVAKMVCPQRSPQRSPEVVPNGVSPDVVDPEVVENGCGGVAFRAQAVRRHSQMSGTTQCYLVSAESR